MFEADDKFGFVHLNWIFLKRNFVVWSTFFDNEKGCEKSTVAEIEMKRALSSADDDDEMFYLNNLSQEVKERKCSWQMAARRGNVPRNTVSTITPKSKSKERKKGHPSSVYVFLSQRRIPELRD